MILNNKPLLIIFLLFMTFNQVKSQTIDELIQSNRENLASLRNSRGTPPEWVYNGNVDKGDLQQVLSSYKANVGLLLYTHEEDTLKIFLIDKHGKTLKNEEFIEEDILINEINRANNWFSNISSTRAPSKRGAKASSTKKMIRLLMKKLMKTLAKPYFHLPMN
jgi:hypothetical protein